MTRASIAELVSAHPLLTGLPDDAVVQVAECASNVGFDPGALLLVEGGPADTLYLLRRGRVAIELHSPGHGSKVIETVGPGGIVGLSWLFPPFRWQFDARATEKVVAIAIDAPCLRAKAQADDALGRALAERVSAMLLDRLQTTRIRVLNLYDEDGAATREAPR